MFSSKTFVFFLSKKMEKNKNKNKTKNYVLGEHLLLTLRSIVATPSTIVVAKLPSAAVVFARSEEEKFW